MSYVILGLSVAFSTFLGVGAQNMYIIKQGLAKDRWKLVALTCFMCDSLTISLGIFGFGAIIGSNRLLSEIITVVGVLFLIYLGLKSFYDITKNHSIVLTQPRSKKAVITTAIAVSLLNPSVFVDVFLIIGGMATTMESTNRFWFWSGVMMASLSWMFLLGSMARVMSPLMKYPITWKILHLITGCIMLYLSYYLAKTYLKVF